MKGIVAKYLLLVVIGAAIIFLNNNEQPYGYWKTSNQTDLEILSNLVADEPSNCKSDVCKKEIVNNEAERIIVVSLNEKSVKIPLITEDEAKQKALTFIKENSDTMGLTTPPTIKAIEKGSNGYGIVLEAQTFGDVNMCSSDSGRVSILNDGSIGSLRLTLYPNLTAPTRPKLSDEQVGKELTKVYEEKAENDPSYKFIKDYNIPIVVEPIERLCIFPRWHPDGEYWTYHLAKVYSISLNVDTPRIGDTLYYDVGGNAGVLFTERPIAG